jgi:hypothetical protein
LGAQRYSGIGNAHLELLRRGVALYHACAGGITGPKCLAMRFHQLIFGALAVLGLSGCPSDEPAVEAPGDGDGDMPFDSSDCPDTLPEMHIGMEAMGVGQVIKGQLDNADKVPIGWYHNDWTVSFSGPDDEALEEVTLTGARTFMRVHGHGGGQTPTINEVVSGKFDVDGLNVTMDGPWEFIFEVSATNADGEEVSDTVTFYVCNSEPKPASMDE